MSYYMKSPQRIIPPISAMSEENPNIPFRSFSIIWMICFILEILTFFITFKFPSFPRELLVYGVLLGEIVLFDIFIWRNPSMRAALIAMAAKLENNSFDRIMMIMKNPLLLFPNESNCMEYFSYRQASVRKANCSVQCWPSRVRTP